jgi:hypothetical protein
MKSARLFDSWVSILLRQDICFPVERHLPAIAVVIHAFFSQFEFQVCAVKGVFKAHGRSATILTIGFFNIEISLDAVCASTNRIDAIKGTPSSIWIEFKPYLLVIRLNKFASREASRGFGGCFGWL